MSLEPEIPNVVETTTAPHSVRGTGISRVYVWGTFWRAGLGLILFTTFFPFIFLVMTSLKDTHQFYHSFWLPAFPLAWQNYAQAFGDLKIYIFNSIFVTAVSISGILICSTITGFLFARYRFPGREIVYYMMLAMLMVPGVLMLIPQFVWVQQLGLLNTFSVMILPYVAGMQIMGMFLLRSFFAQIDQALFESAQVDGAGVFRQLWHIEIGRAHV